MTKAQPNPHRQKDAETDVLLRLEGIACLRSERLLFKGLDLDLHRAQAIRICGPNGCGKSSLIRLIAGLLPAFAGEREILAPLALADEQLALDDERALIDALGYWAQLDGAAAAQRQPANLESAIAAMQLQGLSHIPVRLFSAGQRRRAIIARVIASGAPIWLLDEPGNGLDSRSLEALGRAMQTHLDAGGGIIAASHFPLPLDSMESLNLPDFAP